MLSVSIIYFRMIILKREDILEGILVYCIFENNILFDSFLVNFSMFCLSLVVWKKSDSRFLK